MIVHFICRGNSFRSIIAEAYLNSLGIKEWSALSSGSVGALHKERNLNAYRVTLGLLDTHGIREFAKADYGDQLTQSRLEKADITVCMNQRVYDDCLQLVTFPASPHIWEVADIGEPDRIPHSESEGLRYREEAYQEIVKNVDQLVSGIRGAARVLRPGLVSLAGAQRVQSLQCLGHARDPDLAVVHPGPFLFRGSRAVVDLGHDGRIRAVGG
jgi:protein-tyrosine-phosphatase